MRLKKTLPLLLYLLINFIFVIKYSERLESVNQYLIGAVYVLLIVGLILLYPRIKLSESYFKFLFFAGVIAFLGFSIFLNFNVNGNDLNVDRWSALNVAVRALLHGEYPYKAIDHLGGRSSALPTLILIGIPFYLLGNIGFLQSFAFLIFAYTFTLLFKSFKTKFYGLLLLILSPAYLWEVYVKSDLMSNFIIILLFIVIIHRRFYNNKSVKLWVLAFFSSALVLTRLIAVIPITLLVFKKFWSYTIKNKTLFLIVSLFTIIILGFIGFNKVLDWNQFKEFNPFLLQNRQLPFLVSLITILLPFFFSFTVKDTEDLIWKSGLFLILPVAVSFIIISNDNGLYLSIYKSVADISYFNIALPFILISCLYYEDKILTL